MHRRGGQHDTGTFSIYCIFLLINDFGSYRFMVSAEIFVESRIFRRISCRGYLLSLRR